jgi:hypothetical protein
MIYFLALIPATGLTIAGYFVWYLSSRSEGSFRTFGRYLGFWAFTLAALVVLGAIFAAAHGRHHGGMMGRMHGAGPGGPRFFGPLEDGPRDERFGEFQRRASPPGAPQSEPDTVNPGAAPSPTSPTPTPH